jgi:tetratricopeptide (TPR) repeat protein
VSTHYQDISKRQKDDSNPSKDSPKESGGKNSKVSTTTVDADNPHEFRVLREVSKTLSEKELIEKEYPLKKSEIDLSYAPEGADSVQDTGKTEPEVEEAAISIQSPTEAIFETETRPIEEPLPQEKSKTIVPKERKLRPQKTKAEKSSKVDLGEKRKAKGGQVPKKTKPRISKPTPEQVIMSKGVAYLAGNTIRMTGWIKLHPGDQVKVGEKEFILKPRQRKRKPLYLLFLILLVSVVLVSSLLLKGKSAGRLIGIVLDEKSKTSLSGAEIQIKEVGKMVRSNQLGFFMFDLVPSGSYTLQTDLKGYQTVKDNVTITKNQATTINILLSPKYLTELPDKSSEETIPSERPAPENVASEGTEVEGRYGAINIESNVSEPVVMVDDRMLGTGNKAYKNVSMGKHSLRITKEGYQDWTQNIEVKHGKTLNLKINLSEAEAVTPQTPEDWLALAQSQMNSHDFASAVNSYTQALTLNPKSSEALLGRGLVYNQLNDRAKAVQDLNKAAEYYAIEKNYNQAITCYTHLLTLNDRDLGSLDNRGVCYLRLGQYEKSIQDFEKTIEKDKIFFLGYLHLGEAYHEAGNYEASLENYKKAKKLNPESPQVYAGLALVYFAKGEKSSAKKSFKKFEELSTYIDREKMKQDPEWRKLLQGIEEKAEAEF